MDTKLLGLILQGDKKNKQEFNRIKETYEEMSNSKAHVITSFANGESIVLSDSSNSKLDNLRVMGRSEQFTTTGAQLIIPVIHNNIETNGVTINSTEDGNAVVNGTVTTDLWTNLGDAYLTAGETYVLTGSSEVQFIVWDAVAPGYLTVKLTGTTMRTFTATNSGRHAIVINNNAGNVLNNVLINGMLNKGSTALPYEPYTGGIPSPNPQYPQEIVSAGDDGNIEANVYGKNLHPNEIGDYDRINETGRMFGYGLGNHASSPTNFPIPVGKTLTFSHNHTFPDTGVVKLMQYDENGEYIGRHEKSAKSNTITFIPDEKCKYMSFVIYDSHGVSLDGLRMQLEVGDNATSYEPYHKQPLAIPTPNGLPGIKVTDPTLATYTDEAGQMWCADEVDFERGVYVKRVKKCDVTGSTITWYVANEYFCELKPDDLLNKDGRSPVMSNCFHYSQSTKVEGDAFAYKSTIRLYKTFADLSEARTWFDNNDVNVMYILATPIETPLSESDLEAYKTLHTNYPNTTILNDSGAHMEVKYTADKKNYIDNKFAQITNAVLSMGSNV